MIIIIAFIFLIVGFIILAIVQFKTKSKKTQSTCWLLQFLFGFGALILGRVAPMAICGTPWSWENVDPVSRFVCRDIPGLSLIFLLFIIVIFIAEFVYHKKKNKNQSKQQSSNQSRQKPVKSNTDESNF